MAAACRRTPGCVGFDNKGNLLSYYQTPFKVSQSPIVECPGTYVLDPRDGPVELRWTGLKLDKARGDSMERNSESNHRKWASDRQQASKLDAILAAIAAGSTADVSSLSPSLSANISSMITALGMPASWDSRSTASTGGFDWISTPKDQASCGSCVGFATIGAAEAAVASQLRVNNSYDLSEQDLYFCALGAASPTCATGWYLDTGARVGRQHLCHAAARCPPHV